MGLAQFVTPVSPGKRTRKKQIEETGCASRFPRRHSIGRSTAASGQRRIPPPVGGTPVLRFLLILYRKVGALQLEVDMNHKNSLQLLLGRRCLEPDVPLASPRRPTALCRLAVSAYDLRYLSRIWGETHHIASSGSSMSRQVDVGMADQQLAEIDAFFATNREARAQRRWEYQGLGAFSKEEAMAAAVCFGVMVLRPCLRCAVVSSRDGAGLVRLLCLARPPSLIGKSMLWFLFHCPLRSGACFLRQGNLGI